MHENQIVSCVDERRFLTSYWLVQFKFLNAKYFRSPPKYAPWSWRGGMF
jgi:hypothetical protein